MHFQVFVYFMTSVSFGVNTTVLIWTLQNLKFGPYLLLVPNVLGAHGFCRKNSD